MKSDVAILMGDRQKKSVRSFNRSNRHPVPLSAAREIILDHVTSLGCELVALESSLGRVLCEEITVEDDRPSVPKSTRDGFAVRSKDLAGCSIERPRTLSILGVIKAGDAPSFSLQENTTIKIMTGAQLPPGADSIIPFEDVTAEEAKIEVTRPVRRGQFVLAIGDEAKRGDVVGVPGDIISPMKINVFADCGRGFVRVHLKPRVGILVTGSEVLDVCEQLDDTSVYSSNRFFLASLVDVFGGEPVSLGICHDDVQELETVLESALGLDVLVVTGGTGHGSHDLVKKAWRGLNGELFFDEVAMHPARSSAAGCKNHMLFFSLPGNPAAAGISFMQLVLPAILRKVGLPFTAFPETTAKLHASVSVGKGDYERFLWGRPFLRENGFVVFPLNKLKLGMLRELAASSCIIRFPAGREVWEKGETVFVQPVNYGLLCTCYFK